LFFRLGHFEAWLREWTGVAGNNSQRLAAEVTHKVKEWFDAGLQDWDISRDSP
jgi:methionyl-tRNA synthetase